MMKKAIVAGALALALAPAGAAWAHGPSGSYEGSADHVTQNNNVRCNQSTGLSGSGVNVYAGHLATGAYAGTNGAETCKDGHGITGQSTIQGRIIVSVNGAGSYASADGDRDNPAELQGWAKVSSAGVTCGPTGGGDSTHQAGSSANCG